MIAFEDAKTGQRIELPWNPDDEVINAVGSVLLLLNGGGPVLLEIGGCVFYMRAEILNDYGES